MYKCEMDMRKRERPFPTGLELFLLLVIRDNVDSLFELQRQLGINPGAVSHAVGRLEKKGVLEREPERCRRKRKLTVTSLGHDILKTHWKEAFQKPFEDVPGLIRAVLIVVVMAGSRSPQLGAQMLRDKADKIERSARDCKAPKLLPNGYLADRTELYSWIKQKAEFHQAKGMAAALREVAQDLATVPEDD
jgi:DNA-binding MarR family transcriptional regulator